MFLGLVLVIFGVWVKDAMPTERLANKVLVVRHCFISREFSRIRTSLRSIYRGLHADPVQYWLIFATCGFTVAVHGESMHMLVEGFGQYRGFFDATCGLAPVSCRVQSL